MNYRDVEKILLRHGFEHKAAGTGSHRKFVGVVEGRKRVVVVPDHGAKPLKKGTLANIIRQSGLNKAIFR